MRSVKSSPSKQHTLFLHTKVSVPTCMGIATDYRFGLEGLCVWTRKPVAMAW